MLKSENSSPIAESIQKKIDDGHEIRPFPTSVSQLLSAIKDPETSIADYEKIIEQDAGLSARILRMVNSPMFGFASEIKSIKQAVAMLGHNPLKNLALTYAGTVIVGDKSSKNTSEALWNHSLGCATVARCLASSAESVDPDSAFLSGIFHDVGKILFLDVIPSEYPGLMLSCSGMELLEKEKNLCGVDHAEVGLRMAVTWPISDEIKFAIRYHHEPEADQSGSELSKLIHLADGLARQHGIGSTVAQDMLEPAQQYLGVSQDELGEILEQAATTYEETMDAIGN